MIVLYKEKNHETFQNKNKNKTKHTQITGQKLFTISVELFNYELRLFYFSPYIMLQICDSSLACISTLNHSYT